MRIKKIIPPLLTILLCCAGGAFAQDTLSTFSVKEFWQEFQTDKDKAESMYIGKYFNFTGVVVETGMSIYLTPDVMLSDVAGGQAYLIGVLPRADAKKLSEFKIGDQVTITGRANNIDNNKVIIKECKRVTP